MNLNFFIDIGAAVILRLVASGKIPSAYVKVLLKVRDALNLAFPPDANGQPAPHVEIV
jgi:hypothetical protein